jgi:hypothetical protein
MKSLKLISIVLLISIFYSLPATAQDTSLSFFVTSNGPGNGADLGGLAGADAHCQMLAEGVGAGNRQWRAYLSTQGRNAVNARDRIGSGPWYNANGRVVGRDINELHSFYTRMSMREAVAENGAIIPGGGYAPNRHDILTGSTPEGTAFPGGDDMTCNNWTSSDDGKAKVGHHDRAAWNSAHDSRGCSQEALRSSGGDGLFYCFAAD